MLYALTAPHSHFTYSLLSPLFFILSLWTVKTHRHECNMSLFFLLELTGPGQDNQSSVRHTVKGSHGRGWGSAERQRQRGCGKQNSSSMQQERDGAKTSQTTRGKVRDLCERGGDLCEIAMDDECVSSTGSLMTVGTAVLHYPSATLAERHQTLPWAPFRLMRNTNKLALP